MESTLKEMRNGDCVLDMNNSKCVGGGVEDIYGEDRATEDQLISPWSFSVARLLSKPLINLSYLLMSHNFMFYLIFLWLNWILLLNFDLLILFT